MFSLKKQ